MKKDLLYQTVILILSGFLLLSIINKKKDRVDNLSSLIVQQYTDDKSYFDRRFKSVDSISNPERHKILKHIKYLYQIEEEMVRETGGYKFLKNDYMYLYNGNLKVSRISNNLQSWLIEKGTNISFDSSKTENQVMNQYLTEINETFKGYQWFLKNTKDRNKSVNELMFQMNTCNRFLYNIDLKYFGE